MINTDASTLPGDTRVLVRWYEDDTFLQASGTVTEPTEGAIWRVLLDRPYVGQLGTRRSLTNLTDMGEIVGPIKDEVFEAFAFEPQPTQTVRQPAQLDTVLEDPAVFTDLDGDEIRVDIVAYDQTEDAEAENAYPSGTVVEIECILYEEEDGERTQIDTASVYLNRETLRDLILHLVQVEELAGYAELARANADELAESTAGDPPNPNGCSGGCAGCSR